MKNNAPSSNAQKPVVTRFAPSPTGALHLGHFYSAYFSRALADLYQGQMRLRIDDIDFTRCKPEYTDQIFDDLAFMGLSYDGDVLMQSTRGNRYQDALTVLKDRGYIYPCSLSRREIDALLSAPHGRQQITRNTDQLLKNEGDTTSNKAWRLRMDYICRDITSLSVVDLGEDNIPTTIEVDLDQLDDVVIARKDIGTSYHLSVVLDDNDSGVSIVTRGNDLKAATPIHRLLQYLLDLDETKWAHHTLITDDAGIRLSKRDASKSIQQYRKDGYSAEDIQTLIQR